MDKTIASKYAKALFDQGLESGALKNIWENFEYIAQLLDESDALAQFIQNPILSNEEKEKGIVRLFKGHVHAETLTFLQLLAQKERLVFLKSIWECFERLYLEHTQVLKVRLITPFKLSQGKLTTVVQKLESIFKKKIVPTLNLDPSLIGGLKVQVRDQIYDFTVRHQLEQFQKQLMYS